MHAVLRIGGSVIASPIDSKLIEQYATLLRKLAEKNDTMIVVVGGGTLAREYIGIGNQLGLSATQNDWLAIHVSRLHALLLSLKISEGHTSRIPVSIEDALEAFRRNRIVVLGGLKPGMTTDTVAVKIALQTNAQLLVKATDQDGIFTKDPRKHKDARLLSKISYRDLTELLEYNSHKAGLHQILDPVAIGMLSETNIRTIVVNGYHPENIEKALEGLNVGTIIAE
jgi:uridylate kinase